jgi:hypothetical protein
MGSVQGSVEGSVEGSGARIRMPGISIEANGRDGRATVQVGNVQVIADEKTSAKIYNNVEVVANGQKTSVHTTGVHTTGVNISNSNHMSLVGGWNNPKQGTSIEGGVSWGKVVLAHHQACVLESSYFNNIHSERTTRLMLTKQYARCIHHAISKYADSTAYTDKISDK